jgi:hypothetical protein
LVQAFLGATLADSFRAGGRSYPLRRCQFL